MLELQRVTKSYGRLEVLHESSFTLRRGEICGYLGPNGSGKSTTVKILAGLQQPTQGEVLLDGRPLAGDLDGYKRRLGFVPEEAQVYRHLSGQEYLELVGGLRGLEPAELRPRIRALLEAFGLAGDAVRGGRAVGTVGQVGAEGWGTHVVAARARQTKRRGPDRAGAQGVPGPVER